MSDKKTLLSDKEQRDFINLIEESEKIVESLLDGDTERRKFSDNLSSILSRFEELSSEAENFELFFIRHLVQRLQSAFLSFCLFAVFFNCHFSWTKTKRILTMASSRDFNERMTIRKCIIINRSK